MTRGLIFGEGHGESDSAINLISRLWQHLQLDPTHVWTKVYRSSTLNTEDGIKKACTFARVEGFDKLLILRDEDDLCPRDTGPAGAEWIRESALDIPAALVLLYREYETLFLPCLEIISAANPGGGIHGEQVAWIAPGTTFTGDFESVRGVKEWLSRRFPEGKKYKPRVDQLAMTRLLDFDVLQESGLPCYGSLVRALQFLSSHTGHAVYP
jgi:hypothetical protein